MLIRLSSYLTLNFPSNPMLFIVFFPSSYMPNLNFEKLEVPFP